MAIIDYTPPRIRQVSITEIPEGWTLSPFGFPIMERG